MIKLIYKLTTEHDDAAANSARKVRYYVRQQKKKFYNMASEGWSAHRSLVVFTANIIMMLPVGFPQSHQHLLQGTNILDEKIKILIVRTVCLRNSETDMTLTGNRVYNGLNSATLLLL